MKKTNVDIINAPSFSQDEIKKIPALFQSNQNSTMVKGSKVSFNELNKNVPSVVEKVINDSFVNRVKQVVGFEARFSNALEKMFARNIYLKAILKIFMLSTRVYSYTTKKER